MFGKKRPWRKCARVDRVELNNGTVTYRTYLHRSHGAWVREAYMLGGMSAIRGDEPPHGVFATRQEAISALDAWWLKKTEAEAAERAAAWPLQIKSTRRA